VLQSPLPGDALPMQDVVVKAFSNDTLVVISSSDYAREEELTVHIAMPSGLASHRATVISSEPSSVTGTLLFRLRLRLDDDGESPSRGEQHSREPE
jgi:hypothetical protein